MRRSVHLWLTTRSGAVWLLNLALMAVMTFVPRAEALNQIQNWDLSWNAGGWTLDNQVARGNPMTTWNWTGASGNPAGSYYANAAGSANNQTRDGLIEQTFTVMGGAARGIGRFCHMDTSAGSYDNFRLYCRLHTADATPANPNDNIVATIFSETKTNGAALHTTWQDTGWSAPINLNAGVTYVWRIYWDMQCDNGEQAGAYVDNLKFIISPINLRTSASGTGTLLNWNASTGASTLAQYRVYRSTISGGPYTQIATPTTNSFYDPTPPGGLVYYVVTDVDTDGDESPYSLEAMAFSIAVRDGPTKDIEWSLFDNRVEATWTHPPAPLSSYRVAVGTTPGGTDILNWTDVGMVNRVSLTGVTLASGTRYFVNVIGIDAYGVPQGVGDSNGFVVRGDRVLTDTASSTFFNNGRALFMIDTTTDPGSIRPRTFASGGYWQYRVPVTVTEPNVTDRVNAPCRVQFTIPGGQQPASIGEFRVSDEAGNEVNRFLLPGCTIANPDISFLVDIPRGSTRTYYIHWGNAGAPDPGYGFSNNANQISTIQWTPYYTRKVTETGIENVPLAYNFGYRENPPAGPAVSTPEDWSEEFEYIDGTWQNGGCRSSTYYRDDARSNAITLFGGNFWFFGVNQPTWRVWINGMLYVTNIGDTWYYCGTGNNATDWNQFIGNTRWQYVISPLWVDLKYDMPGYPDNPGVFRDTYADREVFTWRTNIWLSSGSEDDIYIFQAVLYRTGDIAFRYHYLSPRAVIGGASSDPIANVANTVGISNSNSSNYLINTPLANGIGVNPTSFYQCMDAFRGNYTVGTIEAPTTGWANVAHFESMVFDARSETPDWQTIEYDCAGGANGRLVLAVRTGSTPIPDGSWSAWATVATTQVNGTAAIPSPDLRHLQYRCTFQRNANGAMPVLNEIRLVCRALSIVSVTADTPNGVSQGQENIPVAVTVRNDDINPVNLTGASLTFVLGSYSSTLQTPTLPAVINPGTSVVATFLVNVAVDSPTGTDTVNAVATGTNGSVTFGDQGADQPHQWWVRSRANLVIQSIETTPAFVNKGQTGIPVRMTIANQGETPFTFGGASLTFSLGSHTFTLVSPPPGTLVQPLSSFIATFSVNISPTSDSGVVLINGTASGTNTFSGKITDDATADLTDTWTIQNPADLVLNQIFAPPIIARGQVNIPVRLEVLNLGEASAHWDGSALWFTFVPPPAVAKTYTATYPLTVFPLTVFGGFSQTATYGVDVSPLTATGTDLVDADVGYTDLNSQNTATVSGALYPATWTIIAEKVNTYKDASYLYESSSFNRPSAGNKTIYAKAEDLAPLKEFVVRWYDPGMVEVASSNPPLTSDPGGLLYHAFTITPSTAYGQWKVRLTDPLNTYTVCENTFQVVSPASLTVSLTLPPSVSVGQPFTATATFLNTGGALIKSAYPSTLATSGTGVAATTGGPSPAVQDVPGLGQATFTWSLLAVGPGTLIASVSGAGFDGNDDTFLSSATATSNVCLIQNPPVLQIQTLIATPTVVNRNQQDIPVLFTVRNTGSATAIIDGASLSFTLGSYSQTRGSPALPFSLAGGGTTATFSFFVDVDLYCPTGLATLTASLRAYDANWPASLTYLNPAIPNDTWTVATIGIILSRIDTFSPEQYSFNRGQTLFIRAFGLTPGSQWYRIRLYNSLIPTLTLPTGWVNVSPQLAANSSGNSDHLYTLPGAAVLGTWTATIENDPDTNGTTLSNPALALQYFSVQQPGSLIGSLTLSPASVFEGDPVTATLYVRNDLSTAASTIEPATASPLLKTTGSTGDLTFVNGPSPASVSVGAMAGATFTWTFTAASETGLVGSLTMTAQLGSSATGLDRNSEQATSTGRLLSNPFYIYRRALLASPDVWSLGTVGPGQTSASFPGAIINVANATASHVLWNKVDLNGPGGTKIPNTTLTFTPSPAGLINPGQSRPATASLFVPYNQASGTYIATMAVFDDLNGNAQIDLGEAYDRFNVQVDVPAMTAVYTVEPQIDLGDWPKNLTTNVQILHFFNGGNLDLLNLKFQQTAATTTTIVVSPANPGPLAVPLASQASVWAAIPPAAPTGIYLATWTLWDDRDNSATVNATEAYRTFQVRIGIGNISYTLAPSPLNAGSGPPNSTIAAPALTLSNTGELPLSKLRVTPVPLSNGSDTIATSSLSVVPPATVAIGGTGNVAVGIYIPPGTPAGTFSGTQWIFEDTNGNGTYDSFEASASFELQVTVTALANIQVLVSVVDFGGMAPGTGKTVQIPCRNTGNVDLTGLRWEKIDLTGPGTIPAAAYGFPPTEPFAAAAGAFFYHDITLNVPGGQPLGNYLGSSAWLFDSPDAVRDLGEPQDDFQVAVQVGIVSLDVLEPTVTTSGDPASTSLAGAFSVFNDGSLTVTRARATASALIGPVTIPATASVFTPSPIGMVLVGQTAPGSWRVNIPPATPVGVYTGTLTVWDDTNNDGVMQPAEASSTAALELSVNAKRVLKVIQNPLNLGLATEGSIIQGPIEIQNVGNIALSMVRGQAANLVGGVDTIPAGNATFTDPIGAIPVGNSIFATVTVNIGAPRANGTYNGTFLVYEDYNPANGSYQAGAEEYTTFPVTVQVGRKGLTVTPGLVDLGTANPGTTPSFSFTVSNTGDFPLTRVRWLQGNAVSGSDVIASSNLGLAPAAPFTINIAGNRAAVASLSIPAFTPPGTYIGTHTVWEDENNDGQWQAGEASATFNTQVVVPSYPLLTILTSLVDFGSLTQGTSSDWQPVTFQNLGNVPLTGFAWTFMALDDGLGHTIPVGALEASTTYLPDPLNPGQIGTSQVRLTIPGGQFVGTYGPTGGQAFTANAGATTDSCSFLVRVLEAPTGPQFASGTIFQRIATTTWPATPAAPQRFILSGWVCPGTGSVRIGVSQTREDGSVAVSDSVEIASTGHVLVVGPNSIQGGVIESFPFLPPELAGTSLTFYRIYLTFELAFDPLVSSATQVLLENSSPVALGSQAVWLEGIQLERAILPEQIYPTTFNRGHKVVSPNRSADVQGHRYYYQW